MTHASACHWRVSSTRCQPIQIRLGECILFVSLQVRHASTFWWEIVPFCETGGPYHGWKGVTLSGPVIEISEIWTKFLKFGVNPKTLDT